MPNHNDQEDRTLVMTINTNPIDPCPARRAGALARRPAAEPSERGRAAQAATRESSEPAAAVVAPDVSPSLPWVLAFPSYRVAVDHIRRGAFRDGCGCPLALALREAGLSDVYIATSAVHVSTTRIEMSDSVRDWVAAFDDGEAVPSFELVICPGATAAADPVALMAEEIEASQPGEVCDAWAAVDGLLPAGAAKAWT
jgi:hypothetical protein